ncbi:MAG: Mur ligase domain-containing protein [Evtepia sp.]
MIESMTISCPASGRIWWASVVCPCPPWLKCSTGEGLIISGSDMQESPAVEHLRSLGIPVTIGHLPENVAGTDLVIRTAAVHDEQPGDRRRPRCGHPRLRAGPGLGRYHAAL